MAHATYPGANGKISFDTYGQAPSGVWTMNPDGTERDLLAAEGTSSAWSPNGSRVAYTCNRSAENICTAAADGTDVVVLPNHGFTPQRRPYWSPDAKRLVIDDFVNEGHGGISGSLWRIDSADGDDHIHLARAGTSGSWSINGDISYWNFSYDPFNPRDFVAAVSAQFPNNPTVLTETERDYESDWSPDGSKIVFDSYRDGNYEIYVMSAGGTNETRLTTTAAAESSPAWSPDGSKIVFERYDAGVQDLWVMNADGSGAENITNTPGTYEYQPAWQPVRPPGYLRPKSATRVQVPLVPAFFPCQAPNRTHGPPLEHPSCNPPFTHPAGHMTFGASVSGGSPQSTGKVLLKAITGAPGGANDADVRISVNLTDVRRASDLADGTGSLELQVPLRLTEKGDTTGGVFDMDQATMQDYKLRMLAPCVETADPAVGSTCSAMTTANALLPSFQRALVQEGRRAVWQLGRAEVWDGGDDGSIEGRDDNTVLAVQGVFVP